MMSRIGVLSYYVVPGLPRHRVNDYLKRRNPQNDEDKINRIIDIVELYMEISYMDMKSPSRKRHICRARQVAMSLILEHTKKTLQWVGNKFGGRDHSTCIAAKSVVRDMYDTDRKFKELYDKMDSSI